MAKRLTLEEFIEKARNIHGDKYDYSLVDYKNSTTKVKIICPIHGVFEQKPNIHLDGSGCIKCGGNIKLTTNEFIQKSRNIHGDKYNYDITIYNGHENKVKIICPIHGIFEQKANNHLYGADCFKCKGSKKKTSEDFILEANKIHNNKYDYSLVDYKNNKIKIKIICPTHGVFEQVPISHLRNIGCPFCNESKGELKINNFLLKNNILYNREKTFDGCIFKNKMKYDFYLIEYNICIEYDGVQHFKSRKHFGGEKMLLETQYRDKIKNEYCKNNNIRLVRIPYSEYDNIENILNKELKIK